MAYSYMYEEEMLFGILSGLLTSVPSLLFSIATYVLSSLAIYTIAQRRGLNKPWLAWIPVVNCWLLGSLSDQYRYVVKGENKSKRKWLLILNLIQWACAVAMIAVVVVFVVNIVGDAMYGMPEQQMVEEALGMVLSIMGVALPMIAVAIAYAIIRYMALYDVYKSLDPANCVLFLVLSILFGITEPFFLFFNRHKDQGMPPRRQEPAYIPEQPQWQPQPEPWETENKDYL